MNNSKPYIICLMGPTASGKTALACQLTEHLPCDIISVDSAMIYRGLDIGTAKPDAAMLAKYPHQLIDIIDAHESYSVADFCAAAKACINTSLANKRVPLLVGGTMMYFHALQHGLAALPSADPELRASLQQRAEQEGYAKLHAELQSLDPLAASRIHPNDPQRLLRALEVCLLSGKTFSSFHQQKDLLDDNYKVINIGLIPNDRAKLHALIAERFASMLDAGLIDEVRSFFERPEVTQDCPAMRSVGYRQVWSYLAGEYDAATMQHKAVVATRRLAKRQLTWLRSWKNLDALASDEPQLLAKVLARLPEMW